MRPGDLEDSEQWAPVADLMTVLMLIFMLVAFIPSIRTITGDSRVEDDPNSKSNLSRMSDVASLSELQAVDEVETYTSECALMYRELHEEFSGDFDRWQAQLDEDLTFRFTDPEVLFRTGSDEITPFFKQMLSDFFPRYMYLLEDWYTDDEIREIRIEGHTSSEWKGEPDEKKAYMNNMELSQGRARSILGYLINLAEFPRYDSWARPLITANGLSSSQLRDKDGEAVGDTGREDQQQSRRVEFRLLVASCDTKEGV